MSRTYAKSAPERQCEKRVNAEKYKPGFTVTKVKGKILDKCFRLVSALKTARIGCASDLFRRA
jgi:hypothetical protein